MKTNPQTQLNTYKRLTIILAIISVISILGASAVALSAASDHGSISAQTDANTASQQAQTDQQKKDYEQCLTDATNLGTDAMKKIPADLSSADRLQQIQVIQSIVNSTKDDCDRHYHEQ